MVVFGVMDRFGTVLSMPQDRGQAEQGGRPNVTGVLEATTVQAGSSGLAFGSGVSECYAVAAVPGAGVAGPSQQNSVSDCQSR